MELKSEAGPPEPEPSGSGRSRGEIVATPPSLMVWRSLLPDTTCRRDGSRAVRRASPPLPGNGGPRDATSPHDRRGSGAALRSRPALEDLRGHVADWRGHGAGREARRCSPTPADRDQGRRSCRRRPGGRLRVNGDGPFDPAHARSRPVCHRCTCRGSTADGAARPAERCAMPQRAAPCTSRSGWATRQLDIAWSYTTRCPRQQRIAGWLVLRRQVTVNRRGRTPR